MINPYKNMQFWNSPMIDKWEVELFKTCELQKLTEKWYSCVPFTFLYIINNQAYLKWICDHNSAEHPGENRFTLFLYFFWYLFMVTVGDEKLDCKDLGLDHVRLFLCSFLLSLHSAKNLITFSLHSDIFLFIT